MMMSFVRFEILEINWSTSSALPRSSSSRTGTGTPPMKRIIDS